MRKKIIPYDPKLRNVARMLRKNMTLGEILLWNELKGKKIMGYKFQRQRPMNNYVLDFYCKELSLAIEVDGDSHGYLDIQINDAIRQEKLESLGIRFLRINDEDVKEDIDFVVEEIRDWISLNR